MIFWFRLKFTFRRIYHIIWIKNVNFMICNDISKTYFFDQKFVVLYIFCHELFVILFFTTKSNDNFMISRCLSEYNHRFFKQSIKNNIFEIKWLIQIFVKSLQKRLTWQWQIKHEIELSIIFSKRLAKIKKKWIDVWDNLNVFAQNSFEMTKCLFSTFILKKINSNFWFSMNFSKWMKIETISNKNSQ